MIKCKCIDATNKPSSIPNQLWITKGKEYTVIYVYKMVRMNGMLGVVLREKDLETSIEDHGYSCFRIDRFLFRLEDLEALSNLAKDCADLNDFNIDELIEQEVITELEEV
jgi:hypothetical protein